MSSDTQVLRLRRESLDWKRTGDAVIALDRATATYFTTNGSGAILWDRLVEGATLEALVTCLQEMFSIPRNTAIEDTRDFLRLLDRQRLLEVDDGSDGSA